MPLDQYCKDNAIDHIDFIKIDTEGHELSVLRGCEQLIYDHNLKVVQFEFNEMNVMSRSFLRDFYSILAGFSFYRLRQDGLLSLGKYNTRNEIFKFQNIIAVCPTLSDRTAPFRIGNPWR